MFGFPPLLLISAFKCSGGEDGGLTPGLKKGLIVGVAVLVALFVVYGLVSGVGGRAAAAAPVSDRSESSEGAKLERFVVFEAFFYPQFFFFFHRP